MLPLDLTGGRCLGLGHRAQGGAVSAPPVGAGGDCAAGLLSVPGPTHTVVAFAVPRS